MHKFSATFTMKYLLPSFVLLGSCALPGFLGGDETTAQDTMVNTLPIVNFAVLSDNVAGGGVLSVDVVSTLTGLGYSTIINLQHAEEDGVAAEEEAVIAAGLEYLHLPMGGLDFTREQAVAVANAVNNAEGTVLIHCRSCARVTAVWALAEAIDKGLNAEGAADIARNHGCREIPESMVQRVVELLDAN